MESYLHDLIQGLLAAGHELTLWVNQIDVSLPVPEGLTLVLLRPKFLPKFLQKWYFVFALPKHLRQQTTDVIISTTRSLYQDITIVGGTHKGYLATISRRRFKDYLELWLEKTAYQRSKKIVAHSKTIEAELCDLYCLNHNNIFMIYPPVDLERFVFASIQKNKKFTLLFPSTSHKRKGGELLLAALKLLPEAEFELWIAGRPFKAAAALANVKYLGFVDLAKIYPQIDLMVLPSYFEPFGLVVIESLECGRPVLISKYTGAKDLINQDEGLVLEDMTPEALAALILEAKNKVFNIAPNFVARHHLTIFDHVTALSFVLKDTQTTK